MLLLVGCYHDQSVNNGGYVQSRRLSMSSARRIGRVRREVFEAFTRSAASHFAAHSRSTLRPALDWARDVPYCIEVGVQPVERRGKGWGDDCLDGVQLPLMFNRERHDDAANSCV